MRGSRNFHRRGGGVGGVWGVGGLGWGVQVCLTKKSSDNVFFSPQLIMVMQFQRNLSFFKVPEGGPTISRGGGGGVQWLIPYRKTYNL